MNEFIFSAYLIYYKQMGDEVIVIKQVDRSEIKKILLTTIETQKPETVGQIVLATQQTYSLREDQITPLLIELENEGKVHFTKKERAYASKQMPITLKTYVFSNRVAWFWTTIALAMTTAITVFVIPENAYPIAYLRSVVGIVFVLFLPGFAFIKALFPSIAPIKTNSENIDIIERVVLSLGLSLALVPMAGLILNYTPWGIRPIPITLSMLTITVFFSVAAVIRGYYCEIK